MDLAAVIVIIVASLISLAVLHAIIKSAVRQALISHYKTVRLYEKTGEWQPGPHSTTEPKKL